MYLLLILFAIAHADFSFMSMGDWGGDDAPRYTKPGQCDAGHAMETIAQKYNIDTILAVGDNFYHSGVTQSNVDKYMERTFNNVYKGRMLDKARFYAVAGNHDHRGDVEAQINYPLDKWVFPDYWYSFTKDVGNGMTAEFVMIDTVLLVGESFHDIEKDIFVSATGPKYPEKAQSQWTFLEETLRDSTANFLFVVGHYPVYSPCSHGPTADLVEHLRPLLVRYDVTAYIAGHDHCASYVDEGEGPVYPMNGMGDGCCYSAHKLKKLQGLLTSPSDLKFYVDKHTARKYGKPSAGFNSYTLQTDGEMIIRFHNEDGRVIWQTTVTSKRASSVFLSAPNDSSHKYGTFIILAVGSCFISFFISMLYLTCRKSKSSGELNEDLILESQVRSI